LTLDKWFYIRVTLCWKGIQIPSTVTNTDIGGLIVSNFNCTHVLKYTNTIMFHF